MKTKLSQERGQALVLIAVALIGLLAIVALAVDGSSALSDRRHAQNAADTAALAGALAKVNSHRNADDNATTWAKLVNAARDRATANGYGDLVNSTVEVHSPPISGIYSNCSDVHFTCTDYVQVIITSNVNMFFAGIIGIDQIHNRVEAVARTITENNNFNFGGNSVVALSPSGCAVRTGGSTTINVTGGGIFSNSDSSCAYRCIGNSLTGSIPSITTVGGVDASGCPISTTYMPGAKQVEFPPAYNQLAEPPQCLLPLNVNANISVTGSGPNKTATLLQGHYDSLPTGNNNWKNIILNPGVYCIDTSLGVGSTGSLQVMSGSAAGVLLYFRPSSSNPITINGGASVNLWGINANNDSSLSAYTGFLMYVAPNYALATPPKCYIGGGSTSTYLGTIYAPYCDLTIAGNAGLTMQSQLIGYTVDLTGAAGLTLDYTGAPKTTWKIPQQVGLSK